ncbi:MAG: class I SAM-dependent methyltransferase [Anaerolinea sp.]|nr:class I SAM-dependent methyltransferase [Anaerolinea sp.]
MKRCLNCATAFDLPDWSCPACGFAPAVQAGIPIFAPALNNAAASYSSDFFPHLAALEAGHFWFQARNRIIEHLLRRHFSQARSLLEIGCGTGFVLQHIDRCIPGIALTASDLLIDGLHFARRRVPGATFLQMDACDIPFIGEFDVIGAFDVIEHIDADTVALAQMRAALRPGGGLLLSVPQHPRLWSAVDEASYHRRRYTRADLVAKVEQAGFRILETTSFVTLLLPAMLLARARRAHQIVDDSFDLFAEFKLHPGLNRLLAAVMRLETALIGAGIPLRWGGSRLLVARRAG